MAKCLTFSEYILVAFCCLFMFWSMPAKGVPKVEQIASIIWLWIWCEQVPLTKGRVNNVNKTYPAFSQNYQISRYLNFCQRIQLLDCLNFLIQYFCLIQSRFYWSSTFFKGSLKLEAQNKTRIIQKFDTKPLDSTFYQAQCNNWS